MNPNSLNQYWSKWVITVDPGSKWLPSMEDVTSNCTRFGKKYFGLATEMKIIRDDRYYNGRYCIEVITEGHPVHDPAYRRITKEMWSKLLIDGFGAGTTVHINGRLLAGSKQDGKPSEQWISIPNIESSTEMWTNG